MKSIGIAASCVFAFAGCAAPEQSAVLTTCDAPRDTVITVVSVGYAVVNQDPICVGRKNAKITWVLDPTQTSQYELRADSIVVQDTDDEFMNCKASGGGEVDGSRKKISCHDINNKHGQAQPRRYKYAIKVYSAGSALDAKPTATYDPVIMND